VVVDTVRRILDELGLQEEAVEPETGAALPPLAVRV